MYLMLTENELLRQLPSHISQMLQLQKKQLHNKDFHRLDYAHAGRTKTNRARSKISRLCFFLFTRWIKSPMGKVKVSEARGGYPIASLYQSPMGKVKRRSQRIYKRPAN